MIRRLASWSISRIRPAGWHGARRTVLWHPPVGKMRTGFSSSRVIVRFCSILGRAAAIGLLTLAGGATAEEASSPNYVLESSVLANSGGESSSPGFSVMGVAGQTVAPGFAEGIEFTADNGFLNDSDLDADGVGGSEDLCPVEYAGCLDLDHDGCIDLPDPDGDGDGVTVGGCDCDDAVGESWKRPGEALSLRFPLTGGSSDLLEWDPPLDLGSSSVFYGVLRSTDPTDFISPATACFQASTPDLTDLASPTAEPIFYYLIRARNLCPDGFGTVGTTSNQVLRTGKDCYQ